MNIRFEKIISAVEQSKQIRNFEYNSIGTILKQQRRSKNLTLEEVSENICSNSYLSKAENMQIIPKDPILTKLKKRLEINETLEFDEEIYNQTLAYLVEALFLEKELDKGVYRRFSGTVDLKYNLILLGYYVTNNNFVKAEEIYYFLEEEIEKLDNLERDIFLLLAAKILYANGLYFIAYKVLKYIDYKSDNEILLLDARSLFLMSVAKLDKVSGYSSEYNDLIVKLSNRGYYKKISKLKYEWLLTSLKSVSLDEAFHKIDKLEEYTDRQKEYIRLNLYFNLGKYDIILKKLDKKYLLDERRFSLYLLTLDSIGDGVKILDIIYHENNKPNSIILQKLIDCLTVKYNSPAESYYKYLYYGIKNGILTEYNGLFEINVIFKNASQHLSDFKYYKYAKTTRDLLDELNRNFKSGN